jgi:hypothetical protein
MTPLGQPQEVQIALLMRPPGPSLRMGPHSGQSRMFRYQATTVYLPLPRMDLGQVQIVQEVTKFRLLR